MMKPSKYNHFIPYSDDQHIAYNALTNSLALIDKTKLESYYAFCNDGKQLEEDFVADLRKGMFLLNDDLNEQNILRHKLFNSRYNSDYLALTIAPTNDCQFRCVYCYEKDVIKNDYMTEGVQDKLVELLKSRIGLIKSFQVVWYGGEPLMAFEIIKSLSKRFIEICDENKINFNASMITNGYLLNQEILSRLNELKITSLQITIDGLPEVHDRMRPHKDGYGTFDTIMNNLKNGYELLPTVSLRINIDKDNVTAGQGIYNYLNENNMLGKIRPYYGQITNDTNSSHDSQCLNMCNFSEISYDFNYNIYGEDANTPVQYPMLKSNFCGADMKNSYVVDAGGWLYKCWCDIGVDKGRVGSLLNNAYIGDINTLHNYMLFDPTSTAPCMDCDILPICMGGCPFRRLTKNEDKCSIHKYVLSKCLKNAVESFKKMQSISKSDTYDDDNVVYQN